MRRSSAIFFPRFPMYVKSINITNFRNLEAVTSELSQGVNIFYGNNGSGKTNLLEAIFVLCLGRSHRSASETVMINRDTDFYRIEGEVVNDGRAQQLAVAYQRGGRKRVMMDRVPIRLSELYDNVCAVSAGPEDSEIIAGSPSVRRTFLDIYLSQFSRTYLDNLTNYHKVLAQKNAALKNEMDPAPFNELLVDFGSAVILARGNFLDSIAEMAVNYYRKISGGSDLAIEYRPSVQIATDSFVLEEIDRLFREKLTQRREQEQIMKSSLVGPHRDEVYFAVNDLPARTHGSQGELRTAAIALKLAVYHLLKRQRKTEPILLLDEIFAELDRHRAEALIDSFEGFGQVCLTTAQQPPDLLRRDSRNFRIDNGNIAEID